MDKVMELYARATLELLVPHKGQGLVEYALILALVAALMVASLTALRGGLEGAFATAVAAL